MSRIRVLLTKEITQIRRDRSMFGILIVAPLVQLLVMGHAVTTDITHIDLAIRDNDRSYHSREFVRAVTASDYFTPTMLGGSESGDEDMLVSGRAGLILVIPSGFSRTLVAHRPTTVQVLVDGADSNFAVVGLNYLQKAAQLFSARQVRAVARDVAGRGVPLPGVAVEARAWYNPDLRSRFYMVPGLMGVLLLVTTMIVTSMALVKEREDGTMEQLIVTPLRPMELLIGKLAPFIVIGFAELTLALAMILGVFRVPLRGNVLALYFYSGLFLLSTLGLGLFVSTLVKTQQQAMLVAGFFVMMPFVLLSGFFFPVENMPRPIQYVAALIPLKYYLNIIRGIFLKGVWWPDLWRDALALLAWGVGILSLATLKFHKRLD